MTLRSVWRDTLPLPSQSTVMEVGSGIDVWRVATPPYPIPPSLPLTSPSRTYAVIHSSKYVPPNTSPSFPNPYTPGVYIFLKKDLRTFAFAFKLGLFKHEEDNDTPQTACP